MNIFWFTGVYEYVKTERRLFIFNLSNFYDMEMIDLNIK